MNRGFISLILVSSSQFLLCAYEWSRLICISVCLWVAVSMSFISVMFAYEWSRQICISVCLWVAVSMSFISVMFAYEWSRQICISVCLWVAVSMSFISVMFAYEQSLLCLGFHPDIWIEAATYLEHSSKILTEKGVCYHTSRWTTFSTKLWIIINFFSNTLLLLLYNLVFNIAVNMLKYYKRLCISDDILLRNAYKESSTAHDQHKFSWIGCVKTILKFLDLDIFALSRLNLSSPL